MVHRRGVLCLSSVNKRTFHALSKLVSIDFFWNQCCGPKWEGAIGLLREPENKCWSVVCLTCCLDFKPIWKEVGVCRTVCSGAESHAVVRADPSRWQLRALSVNRGDHMVFSHSDFFFLESHSSSPEKVIAGLADLHPPFLVCKAGVHLQSLSIISLCIKLKCQSMHKVCWLIFRAVHCLDSLPGNPC